MCTGIFENTLRTSNKEDKSMGNCRERIKALVERTEHLWFVARWCWEHRMYRELEKTREAIKELLNELEKLKKTCRE